jgi:CheY-like chemotaxis protein
MSDDTLVKLAEAFVKLVGVLIWPAIVLFLALWFRGSLKEFLSNLSELTFKGAGIEATARARTEAVAQLTAATASRGNAAVTPADLAQGAKAAVRVVADTVTPSVIRRAERSTVLWVDDRPNNNVHERQSMEALGVNFVLATSTEEALEKLKQRTFDAIISDMGRPPDSEAGFTLLDKLRAEGDRTPFIIYAGARAIALREEAKRRGASGSTNRADELFEMVLSALKRGGVPSRPTLDNLS